MDTKQFNIKHMEKLRGACIDPGWDLVGARIRHRNVDDMSANGNQNSGFLEK